MSFVKDLFVGSEPDAVNYADPYHSALALAEHLTGWTEGDLIGAKAEVRPVLDLLREKGLSADAAMELEQQLLRMRGDKFQQAYEELGKFADLVLQGYLDPSEVDTIGGLVGSALRQQYEQGQELDFGEVANQIRDQALGTLPRLRSISQEAGRAALDIGEMGRGLGSLDLERFERQFGPMLERLNLAYDDRLRQLNEDLNARGILETPGQYSSPATEARSRVAREYAGELGRVAREAANESLAQTRQDYLARLSEPQLYQAAVEAELSPYTALGGEAQRAADTGLRLHSARSADVSQALGALTGMASQRAEAAAVPYEGRLSELNAAQLRRDQTLGEYLRQRSVPLTQIIGARTGTGSSAYGSSSGLQSSYLQAQQRGREAGQQIGAGFLSAGIAAGLR